MYSNGLPFSEKQKTASMLQRYSSATETLLTAPIPPVSGQYCCMKFIPFRRPMYPIKGMNTWLESMCVCFSISVRLLYRYIINNYYIIKFIYIQVNIILSKYTKQPNPLKPCLFTNLTIGGIKKRLHRDLTITQNKNTYKKHKETQKIVPITAITNL